MKRSIRRLILFTVCFMFFLSGGLAETLSTQAVSLPAFLAKEETPADLSKAVTLRVGVNHCLYGEPTQTITDPAVVSQAVAALNAVTVTGLHDQLGSTETYYDYSLYDHEDKYLFGASFQNGLLMQNDGRYDVTGVEKLFAVEGVLLADGWNQYWGGVDQEESEYLQNLTPRYPCPILPLRGKAASLLRAQDLIGVDIYVSWNEEAGRLKTSDPALTGKVFQALEDIRATGPAPEDGDGQKFFVTLYYLEPMKRFTQSVWLEFEGNRLACGSNTYFVDGLEGLFAIEDVDVLDYLREHYME